MSAWDDVLARALPLDSVTDPARRRLCIGASEAAAIVRPESAYQSPIDVWARKVGLAPEQPATERMRLGTRLEPAVADEYAEREGVSLLRCGPVPHAQHPVVVASPDRLVADRRRSVEIKVASRAGDDWGDPDTDSVPERFIVQCAVQMACLDAEDAHLVALIAGTEVRCYHLARDRELEGLIIDRLVAWWRTHVDANVPPAIDGSENAARYLARRWPRHESEMLPATPAVEEQIAALRDARARAAAADADQRAAENAIKAWLGEHEGCTSSLGKLTWRAARDSRITDWQAVARILGAPESIVADYTTTRPGARRFLVPRDWSREE